MAKSKKIDFKKVAINTVVAGATGVAAEIVSEMVSPTGTDYALYGMLAAGVILPEVVKGNDMVDTIGTSLIAIAGYKISEDNDFKTKLGIKGIGSTSDFRNIGSAGWNPAKTYQAGKVNSKGGKADKAGSNVL